jgi:DNA mismatch repair protein MutS
MMKQYYAIKKKLKDAILFFRMGDFYEMFYEDAHLASRILDIALTSRQKNVDNPIPMCGVPYHAAEGYISKLIEAGHKVAICEQVEDPRTAKGLVKREVVRIITPGTILDSNVLKAKENHYIAAVYPTSERLGLALLDHTTGEFLLTEFAGSNILDRFKDEFYRFAPKEVLILPGLDQTNPFYSFLHQEPIFLVDNQEEWIFDYDMAYQTLLDQFQTRSLEGFGCEELPAAIRAGGALIHYLKETQGEKLRHINKVSHYNTYYYMMLDHATQRNLELVKSLDPLNPQGSLLATLDQTVTAMGGRKLKNWLLHPLRDLATIEKRLQGVNTLYHDPIKRIQLQDLLKEIHDLERLASKIALNATSPRDFIALKNSLTTLPRIEELLQPCTDPMINEVLAGWNNLSEVKELIESAVEEDAPLNWHEGGIIKEGFNTELDQLRVISQQGKDWIIALEEKERHRTKINSLKIGYNKVFGYYLEVTKKHLPLVPDYYIRRQTLVNAERFITPELKEWEDKILGAEEKILQLEEQLFQQIREQIAEKTSQIQIMAQKIAVLDVLASLAQVAQEKNYTKPRMDTGEVIQIIEGRHPILESISLGEKFIPNDTYLNNADTQIILITGPNMAGKSTYLRQVALIVLLAQVGCFVPAKEAQIGVVDRIFTRIGAQDYLARGQSTFMVEMNETANIINNATRKSLIILDEVGRGTSTYDGLSLAWAITEYIHQKIGAKTLFATHYHELTTLAQHFPRIKNYNVAVREWKGKVIFLHKIVDGATDRSYGIQVARLAGIPGEILGRAKEVLQQLENGNRGSYRENLFRHIKGQPWQLHLFYDQPDPIRKKLKEIEINSLTPLEALNKLEELKNLS